MAEIRLLRGETAFVDDEDVALVLRYRWHQHSEGYAVCAVTENGRRKNIWMHRLVSGIKRPDHRDGNKLNNRKNNLRPATQSQNGGNRSVDLALKTSKFKGVYWYRRLQKWRARIKCKSVGMSCQKDLGHFASETEAAQAYNEAARRYFGEFAKLNAV